MPTIDGSISDWSPDARLDTAATGTLGYGLWGVADPDYFYFAITSDDVIIGENTTLWLDTDLDRGTGYQIWGWAGGAEYQVEIAADGTARLYSGGPEETLVAELEAVRSADGRVLEFRIDRSLLAGNPDAVRVYADVNDSAFLPNSYANTNFIVAEPSPSVVTGGKTLDGNLVDWDAATRLDTPATGAAGYAFYGDLTSSPSPFPPTVPRSGRIPRSGWIPTATPRPAIRSGAGPWAANTTSTSRLMARRASIQVPRARPSWPTSTLHTMQMAP